MKMSLMHAAGLHSSVGGMFDWRSRGHKFESQLCYITFVAIDHEIISTVILPLPLIQEGQLSVTGKSTVESRYLEFQGTH